MKLELDKRIPNQSCIFKCFDTDCAKQCIGKKGYFSKIMYGFHHLKSCDYGELIEVVENTNQPFVHEEGSSYEFFIPESLVVPKEVLRPLTIDEFNALFNIGDCVIYRSDDGIYTHHVIYNGYTQELESDDPKDIFLHLGAETISMQSLFDDYEYLTDDTWKPFENSLINSNKC